MVTSPPYGPSTHGRVTTDATGVHKRHHLYGDLLDRGNLANIGHHRLLAGFTRILQTRRYARAVTQLAHSDPAEVDRRVELRMRRQAILSAPNGPILWAVVDEAACGAASRVRSCSGRRSSGSSS